MQVSKPVCYASWIVKVQLQSVVTLSNLSPSESCDEYICLVCVKNAEYYNQINNMLNNVCAEYSFFFFVFDRSIKIFVE